MEDRHPQRKPGRPGSQGADGGPVGGGKRLSAPTRSCVVCRRRAAQDELLRVRLSGSRLTTGAGQGRSAYCCLTRACLDELTRKGRLERALRAPIAAGLKEALAKEIECLPR